MSKGKQEFVAKLHNARALLMRGWTQGEDARDENGSCTNIHSPKAQCWCLVGALAAVGIERDQWDFVYPNGEGESALYWNDAKDRTKAEVLACIDNSIAALQ